MRAIQRLPRREFPAGEWDQHTADLAENWLTEQVIGDTVRAAGEVTRTRLVRGATVISLEMTSGTHMGLTFAFRIDAELAEGEGRGSRRLSRLSDGQRVRVHGTISEIRLTRPMTTAFTDSNRPRGVPEDFDQGEVIMVDLTLEDAALR